jgi:hypothetical protein
MFSNCWLDVTLEGTQKVMDKVMSLFLKNVMSVRLILLIPFLLLATTAASEEYTEEYNRRVVETILDTEKGRPSDGKISAAAADVDTYTVNTGIKSVSYAITHMPHEDPPRGVFKITVGPHRWVDMKARWWKLLKVKDSKYNRAQFWTRPVTANSRRFVEVLVREKKDHLGFELRLVFESGEGAIAVLLKHYDLFLKNAKKNGLYDSRNFNVVARPAHLTSNATPIPVRNLDYSGKWKGPMRNSKGGKITDAELDIKVGKDNKVTGTWFRGWKLLNGTRNGNIITWEHRRVGDGCRDYLNKMVVEPGGTMALLTYHVLDRCNEPKNYSGTHRLSR